MNMFCAYGSAESYTCMSPTRKDDEGWPKDAARVVPHVAPWMSCIGIPNTNDT